MEAMLSKVARTTKFELPALQCHFPFECHPVVAEISKELSEWVVEIMGVENESDKKKLVQWREGVLSCVVHPRGSRDRILLTAKFWWLFCLIDDLMESSEDAPVLKAAVLDVANGVEPGVIPPKGYSYLMLYKDVLGKIRSMAAPSLYSRLLTCLKFNLEQETAFERDCIPSESEYKLRRRESALGEGGCIMTEFTMGIQVSDEDVADAEYVEFVAQAADHMGHNWVFVLLYNSPESTLQDAINRLCEMIHQKELQIMNLELPLRQISRSRQSMPHR